MLIQSKEFPSKNNEVNQLKYISTYKMGQIGITKLIEEPFKTSLNKDNNLSSQHIQINQTPSNNNTNNTNTNNTNTNTNTNTYKAMDNISNKKIIKNHHSSSHNVIHNQSSSDFNCYKKRINKSNKKTNIMINKNDKNQKNESVKLDKNHFSKTTNNLCLYMNNISNNIYNKNSYKNSNSKTKIKSKSNSKIHSVSEYSNYILSSRTPSSTKRNQEKLAISKLTGIEKNETNTNSFQKDNFCGLYLKTNTNQSCIDIIQNYKKRKEDIKLDTPYQMTEFNTYLKVRKRSDIQSQKHSNSNIKTESNKLISSCFFNKENKNNELSEIKDNIYFSEVLSNEDNIKGKPKIKLIHEENKNTNRLYTETNQKEKEFNTNFENNIFPGNKKQNANKNIYTSNNFYNNKRKSSINKNSNKNRFGSKTYSQAKNSENSSTKFKDTKEENIIINNFNKNKNNFNSKSKNSYKTRKNFSVNTSKKQVVKGNDIKENHNNKINFRYNSFADINNNENNMKKEKNKKHNYKESKLGKDLKFENPEELHFFMVNLTQNYIKANSKF